MDTKYIIQDYDGKYFQCCLCYTDTCLWTSRKKDAHVFTELAGRARAIEICRANGLGRECIRIVK